MNDLSTGKLDSNQFNRRSISFYDTFQYCKRATNASEKKHELHNIAIEAGFEPATFLAIRRDALPKYHCTTTPFNFFNQRTL